MEWTVLFDDEFEQWFFQQEVGLQNEISILVDGVIDIGPILSRPRSDTLKGSIYPNLKELRIQYKGDPWRVLYVFDPKQQAIMLVGGCKKGKNEHRWYREMISIAEQRYEKHLEELRKTDG